MHWNGVHNEKAAINSLVAPAIDPVSGQPESKASVLRVEAVDIRHRGFALTLRDVSFADLPYANRSLIDGGWRHDFATDADVMDWQGWLAERLGAAVGTWNWLAFSDDALDVHRIAALRDDALDAVLFVGKGPGTDWLTTQFGSQKLDDAARKSLLLGTAPGADPGPLVCACFGVGQHVISEAIHREDLCSTDLIGSALKAGTNCGSCLPELRSLIKSAVICQSRASCQPATPLVNPDVDLVDV